MKFNQKMIKLKIKKWECINEYVGTMRKTTHMKMDWIVHKKRMCCRKQITGLKHKIRGM